MMINLQIAEEVQKLASTIRLGKKAEVIIVLSVRAKISTRLLSFRKFIYTYLQYENTGGVDTYGEQAV